MPATNERDGRPGLGTEGGDGMKERASDSNSLKTSLQEWLEQHGYPLEMRSAKAFAEAGFHVIQGVTYKDPTSATVREIDLQALRALAIEFEKGKRMLSVFLRFTVECKSTKGKPWMAFTAHPHPFDFSGFPFFLSRGSEHLFEFATILNSIAPEQGRFPTPDPTDLPQAYAVTVAFRKPNENDLAYAAVKAVASAAESLEKEEDLDMLRHGFLGLHDQVPIVVIDQPLFLASLLPDQSVQVKPVRAVAARVSESPETGPVFVVTEEYLPKFLQSISERFATFENSFSQLPLETRERIWSQFLERLGEGVANAV